MPEQKRKKQREAMLANMERGDEIITAGGVYGKITALTDTVATVEIAPNTRIRVSRQHVSPAGTPDNGAGSKEPDKDKNKDKNKGKGKKKYK